MGLGLLLQPPAWAGSLVGSLEVDAEATDFFEVTCSDAGNGAPASLVVSIEDTAPLAAPLMSEQIVKGNAATNTTDPVDGDAVESSDVFVDGGAGTYDVFVDKTESGVESYVLRFACMTGAGGTGVETGTTIAGTEMTIPAVSSLGQVGMALLVLGLGLRVLWRRAS